MCSVLEQQLMEPVYLTNACCESAHGCVKDFLVLGLPFSAFNIVNGGLRDLNGLVQFHPNEDFYPLTVREAEFIAENCFETTGGAGMMGYTSLYQGKKYLFPSVEVGYRNEATRARWGSPLIYEEDLPDRETAKAEVDALAEKVRPAVEAVGGKVFVNYDDGCEDRHTLSLLIPFEHAYRLGDFKAFQSWLNSIFA